VAKVWSLATQADGVSEIAPRAASELRGKVRFIDVREPQEYQEGHIPDSELVPMRTVPDAAVGWAHDEPLVIVCRSGRRSAQIIQELAQLGLTRLLNLRGGVVEWRDAGLALDSGKAQLS
jgi:rhodanese-related sulfurtransferase